MKKTDLEESARRANSLVSKLPGYWSVEVSNGYWRIWWWNKDDDPKQFGWYAQGTDHAGREILYGPSKSLEEAVQWVNRRGWNREAHCSAWRK